jgi:hypothetical protein
MATPLNDDSVPLCGPDDLAVTVRWERDGTGLRGQIIAENIGPRACELAFKPTVTPLRPDDTPLPTRTSVTLEMQIPGYVILQPGDRAASRISWSSWCGEQASDRAHVEWHGGAATAEVEGPVQPDCDPDNPDNLSSYWWSHQDPENFDPL